jgi:hypothetical protein
VGEPLTPEHLARLRQLHEYATPGPWEQAPWFTNTILPKRWVDGDAADIEPEQRGPFTSIHAHKVADADLITEARNALPALLDEIESLRETVAILSDDETTADDAAEESPLTAEYRHRYGSRADRGVD